MADPLNRTPRFSVGDKVVVVGPGNMYRGNEGVVAALTDAPGGFIYRYTVQFENGRTSSFFGFELELAADF